MQIFNAIHVTLKNCQEPEDKAIECHSGIQDDSSISGAYMVDVVPRLLLKRYSHGQ